MKVADMHTKTAKELMAHANKLRARISETKAKLGIEEVKDIRTLRSDRREMAAALTIASQKEKEE